jgi:CheY-like chemotaxis protein
MFSLNQSTVKFDVLHRDLNGLNLLALNWLDSMYKLAVMSKIFIIDDYPINLRVAELIVRSNKQFEQITTYEHADSALRDLINNCDDLNYLPDLIFLDLNMPVMDGWQFIEKFEEIYSSLKKDVKIIILTSSTDQHDIQRSKQYSVVKGFYSKPLTTEMLLDITTRFACAS